jgi:hypothetical protein
VRREKKEAGKFFGCKSALTHNGKSFTRDRSGREEKKKVKKQKKLSESKKLRHH